MHRTEQNQKSTQLKEWQRSQTESQKTLTTGSALMIDSPSSRLTISVASRAGFPALSLRLSRCRPGQTADTLFLNIPINPAQWLAVQNALTQCLNGEIVINTASGSARFTQPLVKNTN